MNTKHNPYNDYNHFDTSKEPSNLWSYHDCQCMYSDMKFCNDLIKKYQDCTDIYHSHRFLHIFFNKLFFFYLSHRSYPSLRNSVINYTCMLRRLPTLNRVWCRWILYTCDAAGMYSLLNTLDGYPVELSDNCIIDTYFAQRDSYDRNASLCSYIKQHTAFIYRRMCKMKYC